MGTHEEGTSFENKLAHFVEGLSGLDYTDAIWFLTEVKRAAEESTQLSRANAELRAALETAAAAMSLQQVLERGRFDKTAHAWTPIIERCNAALGTSKLTTTEAKK